MSDETFGLYCNQCQYQERGEAITIPCPQCGSYDVDLFYCDELLELRTAGNSRVLPILQIIDDAFQNWKLFWERYVKKTLDTDDPA